MSSEARHTPGPWTPEGSFVVAYGEHGANICAVSEPRSSAVVEYTRPSLRSDYGEEIYANARLIAAAPELLEAGNRVMNAIYMQRDNAELTAATNELAEAIMKAEERS